LPKSQGELTGFVGLDIRSLGIPTQEEYVARYCERTGREAIPNFSFFVAFSLFRIAAICQGVYKRGLDGNASDAAAGRFGKSAIQLAEVAWLVAASTVS